MKTAKIPVYGNIAVYEHIALSVYRIGYKLRSVEYTCTVTWTIKTLRALYTTLALFDLQMVKTLPHVLYDRTHVDAHDKIVLVTTSALQWVD